jgi:hypothetical protein
MIAAPWIARCGAVAQANTTVVAGASTAWSIWWRRTLIEGAGNSMPAAKVPARRKGVAVGQAPTQMPQPAHRVASTRASRV